MGERRDAAERICATLRRSGYRALLAGGCVRDMLLGVEPKDYDIATNATPAEIAKLFSRTVGVGAAFGVQLVLLPEGQFEVTTFRHDGPYQDGRHPSFVEFCDERTDAERRDFTVNALFYDPASKDVVDYVHGREDLERQVIRAVGDPVQRFDEDHLRLLRAVRFAARLGYTIDPPTKDAIRAKAPRIGTTSAERIRDELVKILTEGGAKHAFDLMDETGLLEQILPEISLMKGVDQPAEFHPEGDVFVHTLLALDELTDPTPTLAMGVLLHDVGKPQTQTFEDRIRFNQHEKAGAEMALAICHRLRFSNKDTERIVWLVDQHMRVGMTPRMKESKLKRFVREEGFAELLELCRIDCVASHGDLDIVTWLKEYIASVPPEAIRPKPLLNGHDLIALGYTPGALFSEILSAVEDAQLEMALSNTEEARAWVMSHWPLPGRGPTP
ncbi:MAG: CCA tRNA nucleotidyltransferase [Candidatus Hydrogenedentes bacterium]|nr:CCA tRNA nucleotidyltransferase [Candidatus Hydrogenedentota bacterium]